MNPIFATVGGRKFLMAIIAMIAAVVMKYTNFDQVTALAIVGTAISYIVGQSVADAATDGKTSSTVQNQQEKV